MALFFKSYLYPQVYDFFVKAVSARYDIKLSIMKTCVDLSLLTASVVMSLCFFKGFEGIGFGTLIMAIINGTLIGWFSRLLDKIFEISPRFSKFAALFALEKRPCETSGNSEIPQGHSAI